MHSLHVSDSVKAFPLWTQTMWHPLFGEKHEEILKHLSAPGDVTLIHVIAAPGTGKDALRDALIAKINSQYSDQMKVNRDLVPIAGTKLRGTAKFGWIPFYRDALTASVTANTWCESAGDGHRQLQAKFVERGIVAFWVDEAHHMLAGFSSPRGIETQADVIKSITQDVPTKLVLFGTARMLPLIRTNGESGRRSRVVHLRRYRNTASDRTLFRKTLQFLDGNCAEFLSLNLADHHEYIYVGCLGLVGELRNWLINALALSGARGRITKEALDQTIPDVQTVLPNCIEDQFIAEKIALSADTLAQRDQLLKAENDGSEDTKLDLHAKTPANKIQRPPRKRHPRRNRTGDTQSNE